jgi:hypothetical protein
MFHRLNTLQDYFFTVVIYKIELFMTSTPRTVHFLSELIFEKAEQQKPED